MYADPAWLAILDMHFADGPLPPNTHPLATPP